MPGWRREHEPSLTESLRKSDLRRAENVVASEAIARESVANLGSVMTSKINLRLGRVVTQLTWVAVVTGLLALVVSVIALVVSL